MSTVPPKELLKLWKQQKITVEMAIGYLIQNQVKLAEKEAEQRKTLLSLRHDVDSLIAHTQMPPHKRQ